MPDADYAFRFLFSHFYAGRRLFSAHLFRYAAAAFATMLFHTATDFFHFAFAFIA